MERTLVLMLPNSTTQSLLLAGSWNRNPGYSRMNSTTATMIGPQSVVTISLSNKGCCDQGTLGGILTSRRRSGGGNKRQWNAILGKDATERRQRKERKASDQSSFAREERWLAQL